MKNLLVCRGFWVVILVCGIGWFFCFFMLEGGDFVLIGFMNMFWEVILSCSEVGFVDIVERLFRWVIVVVIIRLVLCVRVSGGECRI